MMQANVVAQSRWVLRVLWLIAGLLVMGILSVRSNSVLSQSQQLLGAYKKSAALAFTVPNEGRDAPHSFDALTWPDHAPVPIHPGFTAAVVAGTPLTLSGWAFDQSANATFAGIGAKIDDRPGTYYGIVGLPRADVAIALRNRQAERAGFSSVIETTNLGAGKHTITVRALASDKKSAVTLGVVAFAVVDRNVAAQTTDAIDAMNGIFIDAAASQKIPIGVTRSLKRITLYGWGFVTSGRRLASTMFLLVDGTPAAAARYGLPRPDVANAFHDVRMSRCGFDATLPLETLPAGIHEIRLRMGLSDGTTIDSATTVRIDVRGYL